MYKYLSVIWLLLLSVYAVGQQIQSDAYDFPFKRGGGEWNNLESYQAKRDACQVPESVLSSMSTKGLIETYLNYPLLGDLMVFHTLQDGIGKLEENFNGARELLQRDDVGTALVEKYESMNPTAIEADWSLIDKGEYSFKIIAIEVLLSQEKVLSSLSQADRKDLVKLANDKLEDKQKNQEVYGHTAYCASAWIMARTLQKEKHNLEIRDDSHKDQYNAFLEKGISPTPEVLDNMISQVQVFISK